MTEANQRCVTTNVSLWWRLEGRPQSISYDHQQTITLSSLGSG